MYDAEKFVSKNVDTLPTDLQSCTEKCRNEIINTPRLEGGRPQSNIAAATVWTKYRRQLTSLMTSLRKTESRYIRCIKPNEEKKPIIMEHNSVVEQLRCAGVVAGITITRSVFPNHLLNIAVLLRFSYMEEFKLINETEEKRIADLKAFLNLALQPKETVDENGRIVKAFVVGKTKTYFRAGALEWLESHRVSSMDSLAIRIQKAARGWRVRNAVKIEREDLRMTELEKERARQEESARISQRELEARERRACHKVEMQKCEEEIAMLEKKVEDGNRATEERIKIAQEKTEQGLRENEELEKELQLKYKQIMMEKARQNTRLAEYGRIIAFLKKENKKLRKGQMKTKGYHEDMTDNSERLDDNLEIMRSSISNLEPSATKIDVKHSSLQLRFQEIQKRNTELRSKVLKTQGRYMDQAKVRLGHQKALNQVLTIMREKCRDKNLTEDVTFIAYDVDTETKCIMAGLDAETTEGSVWDHEHSSSSGLSLQVDDLELK
jgi:myosin heavy subunit